MNAQSMGIMKLRSLMAQDDKVILLPWTCTDYIVSVICLEYKGKKEFLKLIDISPGNDDDFKQNLTAEYR